MRKASFEQIAYFRTEKEMRKKLFGALPKLSPSERPWTRYMLTIWGRNYQGDDSPDGLNINVIGRLMTRDEWDDGSSTLIRATFDNCRKMGYTGNELIEKVKEIIAPNKSTLGALRLAKEKDDAEFVEKCINEILPTSNPLRDVVIKRYKQCKSPQNILEELSRKTGIDLDSAKRRVRWACAMIEDAIHPMVSDVK
ncbi:hypothetical protein AB7X06_19455 [Providencia rettgeri]